MKFVTPRHFIATPATTRTSCGVLHRPEHTATIATSDRKRVTCAGCRRTREYRNTDQCTCGSATSQHLSGCAIFGRMKNVTPR